MASCAICVRPAEDGGRLQHENRLDAGPHCGAERVLEVVRRILQVQWLELETHRAIGRFQHLEPVAPTKDSTQHCCAAGFQFGFCLLGVMSAGRNPAVGAVHVRFAPKAIAEPSHTNLPLSADIVAKVFFALVIKNSPGYQRSRISREAC
jgi:hypothetical protein